MEPVSVCDVSSWRVCGPVSHLVSEGTGFYPGKFGILFILKAQTAYF